MTRNLTANNLFKRFSGRTVVDDVSIKVTEGEVVGFLGPNGAGKTTTFYIVTGLIRPDSGSVSIDGADISRIPMHRRALAGITYLPQESTIFRKLSVEDNILAILESMDLDKNDREDRLHELLSELKIEHIRASMAYALSGGERRRVEIARSLCLNPKFILFDEPFAGIDPLLISDIKDIIRDLKSKGIGIIISDHNVRDTLTICDRAYVLNEGKILFAGLPKDLVENESVRTLYLGEEFDINL